MAGRCTSRYQPAPRPQPSNGFRQFAASIGGIPPLLLARADEVIE